MVRELAWLDIGITALSEVRIAEQVFVLENGSDYTLFWCGTNKDERRLCCQLLDQNFLFQKTTELSIRSF